MERLRAAVAVGEGGRATALVEEGKSRATGLEFLMFTRADSVGGVALLLRSGEFQSPPCCVLKG